MFLKLKNIKFKHREIETFHIQTRCMQFKKNQIE